MAKIDIYGSNCDFPGLPLAVLVTYRPTAHTHYIVWEEKKDDWRVSAWLRLLSSIEDIGSIQFYPLRDEGDTRTTAALYERASHLKPAFWYMTDLLLANVVPGKWWHGCPYRIAKHTDYYDKLSDIAELDRMILARYRETGVKPRLSPSWQQSHDNLIDTLSNLIDDTAGNHDATSAARDARQC